MHKCEHCGTEFDSKFCPNCGTPAPLEACPNCGAKLSPTDKFCPECGKPLRAPAVPQPAPVPSAPTHSAASPAKPAPSPALMKFLSFLPYVTPVLFGVFSALLFLIFLGSVSTAMGMGTGSVYDYLSAPASMGAMMGSGTVTNVCTALIVFAVLGAVLAACALAFRLSVPLRAKTMGRHRVCTLLNGGIFLFYFIDFLLACILCGTVAGPLTSPGAGPVCALVFALLFGLCSAGAVLVWRYRNKICPAAAEKLERQKAAWRAALTKPAAPQEVEKPTYKRPVECSKSLLMPLRKYEKAKQLFIVLASLGVFVAALSWLFNAVIPYMDNKSHPLLGSALASMEQGSDMSVAMICAWPIAFGLYFILGGSIGAAYYKKKKSGPKRRPEQILSNKQFIVAGIVLPIILFALNLVLAGILYAAYGWEKVYSLDPSTMQAAGSVYMRAPLGKYLVGATILDAIMTATYLVGELPFFCHILKRGRELRMQVYPGEAAYRKYLLQRKEYRKQLAYFEEGFALK